MSFAAIAIWYAFGIACVMTLAMVRYSPGLKPIGRRPRDVWGLGLLAFAVGVVVHAPYFAAPWLWETTWRGLPCWLTVPHVSLIMVLLTRFKWLGRLLAPKSLRDRPAAFLAAWLSCLGYVAPILAYTWGSGWW